MADQDQDQKDYQDYLDYQEFQKYQNSQGSSADKVVSMAHMDPNSASARVMHDADSAFTTPSGVQKSLAAYVLPGSAGKLAEGAGTAGRIGTAALQGGTAAVSQENPNQDYGSKLGTFLKGGAVGGGLSSLAETLGPLASKWANGSMKRAVGLVGAKSKNAPADIGNRIADMGIWGTKSGMADQVSQKYGEAEAGVQKLAEELEGSVPSDTIAKAVEESASRHLDPATGQALPSAEAGVAAKQGLAKNIRESGAGYSPGTPSQTNTRSMMGSDGDLVPLSSETTPGTPGTPGSYGGRSLLALKRAGDEEAFTQAGVMGNSYKAEASRAQADAARKGLSDLSGGEIPKALKDEQTLVYANKGLKQPDMTYKNPVSLTDIGASMASSGGLPGAAKAVLTSKAVVSPLVQSLWAQGLQKGAMPSAEALSNPNTQQAIIQGLFNADQKK